MISSPKAIKPKKLIETNKGFLGPYKETDFNGKEAEVIIYVSQPYDIEMHALSRARRLLILVTIEKNYRVNNPSGSYSISASQNLRDEQTLNTLNEAVKMNLVKKISMVESPEI